MEQPEVKNEKSELKEKESGRVLASLYVGLSVHATIDPYDHWSVRMFMMPSQKRVQGASSSR